MPLTGRRLRVLIVEDEPLYRCLLATAVGQDVALQVAGAFADGQSAVEAAPGLTPDVALLDLDLGGRAPDGLQTALLLRRALPRLGVVLLSNHAAPRLLGALPPETVAGWCYLQKRSVPDLTSLRLTLCAAAHGYVALDPALVAARVPYPGGALARLTPRQLDIVQLLTQGWSNEGIAARLSLAPKTVDNQLSQIYQALGLDRSVDGVHPRVRTVLLYLEETAAMPVGAP